MNARPDLSEEQMQAVIDQLASNGITVNRESKIEQNKSITLYPDGHFFDFGSDNIDGDARDSLYYYDVSELLRLRPSLINAPVQPKSYKPSKENYTRPDIDKLTDTCIEYHKELLEFYGLEEPSLLKELDEFLPPDWLKDGYPDCMGYRASGVKTLTVSAMDSDGKAQAVCYRRDRKLVVTDNDDGRTESRKTVEIKWRTDGSKKFIPLKLTGKDDVYLASGMGELVMLDLLGVDYICLQSDGMAKHLLKPKEQLQHLIILPDNDDAFMKRVDSILAALNPKKASIVKWGHRDPRDAAIALKTRGKFIEEVSRHLEEVEVADEEMPKTKAVATVDDFEHVEFELISSTMETKPIHPNKFKDMVSARMKHLSPSYNITDKMMDGYTQFGATYNSVCVANQEGTEPTTTIIPASTGSAKSVSAKLYLANISKLGFSGLLVVAEISDAIEAAIEINHMVGKQVAGVYYSAGEKNPDHELRVEVDALPQILILSHSMFISRSNTGKDVDLLKSFKTKQRDCIIVDERINLVKSSAFGTDEVNELTSILSRDGDEQLRQMVSAISDVKDFLIRKVNGSFKYDGKMEKHLKLFRRDLLDLAKLLKQGKYNIKPRMKGKSQNTDMERRNVVSLLDRMAFVLDGRFVHSKEGRNLMLARGENLIKAFGSIVVLDATSEINPQYVYSALNLDDIRLLKRTPVRTYSNVTLNICNNKKLPQSKTGLLSKPKKEKYLAAVIANYISAIGSILKPEDTLLVVTYKDMVPILKDNFPYDNVTFVHYGSSDARGSNKYSSFTKAMAIGWYRLPRHYYDNAVASITDWDTYISTYGSKAQDSYRLEQMLIIDDLVQFFNRVRCRVAIDADGNCAETELYLFTGGRDSMEGLIKEVMLEEMEQINIRVWEPIISNELQTKTSKIEERAELFIEWMLSVNNEYDSVSIKDIMEHFSLSRNMINKVVSPTKEEDNYFTMLCDEEGIVKFKEGKTVFYKLPAGEAYDPTINPDGKGGLIREAIKILDGLKTTKM